MPAKRFITAMVIASLGGFTLAMILLPADEQSSQPTSTRAPTVIPKVDARSEQAMSLNNDLRHTPAARMADPGPLPKSLQGSQHDVRLQVDAQGHLLIEEGLLRLFDFYLAGIEEEGASKVLTRIHRELAAQLQGQALEQARDLLVRYVNYRIALQGLPPASETLQADALRQRLEALNALRLSYFSAEENQVFFARENAENTYMVQRMAVMQQSGLTDTQRQQAILELEAALPVEVREERAAATRNGELYSKVLTLQTQGASAEEIRQVREQTLGSEAADRLAELDQQHALWNQRLKDYASERNRLRSAGLSNADLENAIAELQTSRFDELERKRVQALDAEL